MFLVRVRPLILVASAFVAIGLAACSDGGSDGGSDAAAGDGEGICAFASAADYERAGFQRKLTGVEEDTFSSDGDEVPTCALSFPSGSSLQVLNYTVFDAANVAPPPDVDEFFEVADIPGVGEVARIDHEQDSDSESNVLTILAGGKVLVFSVPTELADRDAAIAIAKVLGKGLAAA